MGRRSVRKVLIVACTEFQHAVRSKAFLIGIAADAALIGAAGGDPEVRRRRADTAERRFAVVDRRPASSIAMLSPSPMQWNAAQRDEDGSVKRRRASACTKCRYRAEPAARTTLRLELSDQVRDDELFAFVELPERALRARRRRIRYYTDSPTFQPLPGWLEAGRRTRSSSPSGCATRNVDPQTMLALVRDDAARIASGC